MSPIRLGLDVFSLRSQGLSPFAVLDWCAARGIGLVHFSEPRLIGAVDHDSLTRGCRSGNRLRSNRRHE